MKREQETEGEGEKFLRGKEREIGRKKREKKQYKERQNSKQMETEKERRRRSLIKREDSLIFRSRNQKISL